MVTETRPVIVSLSTLMRAWDCIEKTPYFILADEILFGDFMVDPKNGISRENLGKALDHPKSKWSKQFLKKYHKLKHKYKPSFDTFYRTKKPTMEEAIKKFSSYYSRVIENNPSLDIFKNGIRESDIALLYAFDATKYAYELICKLYIVGWSDDHKFPVEDMYLAYNSKHDFLWSIACGDIYVSRQTPFWKVYHDTLFNTLKTFLGEPLNKEDAQKFLKEKHVTADEVDEYEYVWRFTLVE